MANANTLKVFVGGTLRGQIPSQVLAAVTETALVQNTDSGTPVTAILSVPAGAGVGGSETPLAVNANASQIGRYGQFYGAARGVTENPQFSPTTFDAGRPFKIRFIATGSAAANAGNTLTVKVYQGTSATIGSDTLFATPVNALATATAANFRVQFELECAWDSTSGTLTALQEGYTLYNGTNTAIARTAVAALTGIAAVTSLGFVVSITWGNAVGGTLATTEWSLEQE